MLRRCFVAPWPEHALAAELLSAAADALLVGKFEEAGSLLQASDLVRLEEYRFKIAGPLDSRIHRITKKPLYERVQRSEVARMPPAEVVRQVLARDGFRCRFCGSRVVVQEARNAFIRALPGVVRWGRTNRSRHFGLAVLSASIDHVLPFQRGGCNCSDNLVTACNPCQFGRADCLLSEVEIEDPRNYPPTRDDWDGLTRLRGFNPRRGHSGSSTLLTSRE